MLWHRSIVHITTVFGTIILSAPISLANISLANTNLANNPTEIIRNWSQYEAYDGSYRVAFPKKPTESKDYLDTEIGKVYFVEARYFDNNNYYRKIGFKTPSFAPLTDGFLTLADFGFGYIF
jgi:hypothetical protein